VGAFSHKFSIAYNAETTDQIKKKVRGCKNGTSSITVPRMVGIVGRALAVDEKVCFLFVFVLFFTCRPARSADMPILFLLSGPKWVFRPAGATRCPDTRQIWHGTPSNLARGPRAKFRVYRGKNVGTQSPKLSKCRILAINLPLGAHSFSQFLQNSQFCTRL